MGGLAQNVQKTPPGKNVQKSQGQIFQECQECQECQGQMPRSNAKVKCQGRIFQECVECQEFQECGEKMETSRNRFFPVKTGLEFLRKKKKPKRLKEKMIM